LEKFVIFRDGEKPEKPEKYLYTPGQRTHKLKRGGDRDYINIHNLSAPQRSYTCRPPKGADPDIE